MVLVRVVLAVILTGQKKVKGAKVNLIHTGKVITVLRAIMAIRNPRVAKVSPIHMVKAAMAIRVVMENLMAIKKHQPMEVMGDMDRVLLNMSCIISTN